MLLEQPSNTAVAYMYSATSKGRMGECLCDRVLIHPGGKLQDEPSSNSIDNPVVPSQTDLRVTWDFEIQLTWKLFNSLSNLVGIYFFNSLQNFVTHFST